jgi:hypothetical protein
VVATLVALAAEAGALPIELKDQNGTKYQINTEVNPLLRNSAASGAATNATYTKGVTVTVFYVGITPFGFFLTTFTTQHQVNVPLTNAFAGFNGLVISGLNGAALQAQVAYNPGAPLASEECLQGNVNRQLVFPPQSFPALNLTLSRKVLVPNNGSFVRWLNIITNNASTDQQVGVTLQGLLGSATNTKIGATSSGDSTVSPEDLWFTSGQQVPNNTFNDEPTVGWVVQGSNAATRASSLGVNSAGQAFATYIPTIPAGGTVIIMTMATVQGNFKQAKNTTSNIVTLPSNTIQCMSEVELSQVVNFEKITPPDTKNMTVQLNFKKAGQGKDTIQWKGKVTIAAGISLDGIPITVDVGGNSQNFILNKSGKANNGDGNKFNLQASLKKGVTKVGNVKVSFNLKGNFQETLAPFGLTNATVSNVPVSLPLSFTVGTVAHYGTDLPLTYKAKEGKSGTAKTS